MALILGLVGEKLSGKDTVANYLVERYGAGHVRHTHILDEMLVLLNLPVSRRNEIDLGMGLRRLFGDGVLGKALAERVRKSPQAIMVINGIRFADELANAKQLGAKIIYLTAPIQTRYKRFLTRNEKADDATQTFPEFQEQEKEVTEIGIADLGAQADYKLENNGSLEELYKKLDDLMKKLQPHGPV